MPIIPDIENLRTSSSWWSYAIHGVLAAMLVFMPLALGAVEAWSELMVISAAAVISLCLLLRAALDRQFQLVRTWTYVPLGLFLLLIAFQQVPLPVEWVDTLSPSTLATKNELLGAAGPSESPIHQTTLSYYPRNTAQMFRLVLVGTTIFFIVVNTFRSTQRIVLLLTVVFVIGCAEAFLALAQIATLAKQIYWSVGKEAGHVVTAGSFINHSHFSQFVNLSLGAGVALLMVRLHGRQSNKFHGEPTQSTRSFLWEDHGWLLAGIVLCAISVLTSMSRNGAISLFVASAILGTAMARRGSLSWKGWLLAILPLGVLAGLFLAGFDAVYERLATLQDQHDLEGRLEITTGTLQAWRETPIWGSGLGTHEFVFPRFDTNVIRAIAGHADNEYAQLLEETGLLGAAIVGLFLAQIVWCSIRLMFKGHTPLAAASFGLGLGLLAVAIHSISDFGQRLPAIFCLSAIACGLLVAISKIEKREARSELRVARNEKRYSLVSFSQLATRYSLLLGLAILWGWAWKGAYANYQGEQWWGVTVGEEEILREKNWQGSDQDYGNLLVASENARDSEPDNVKYGFWLNFFRWQSLSRTVDPETGQVLLHPEVMPFVEKIADDLVEVRKICPTYGPPYALEGQLRLFVLQDDAGADLIQKGYLLASYDPPTCFVAGELAAHQGRPEEARQRLQKAVQLDRSYYRAVLEIFLFDLERPDWAQDLAANHYGRLLQLAALCEKDERFQDIAEKLREDAETDLRRRVANEDATAGEIATLANIEYKKGQIDSAVDLYRRSLVLDYSQVGRRMILARALAEIGRTKEAIHEARICLRLKPGLSAAKDLIGRLSLVDP